MKYVKATEKKGSADKMAQAQMKGLPGALERMKGSLETAALVAGKVMAPVIEDLAGFIEGLANKFSELPAPVQRVILVALVVVAALGPVLWIMGAIAGGIPVLVGAIGLLGSALTFLAANPIVLAIALIIIAFAALYMKVKWFRDGVNAVVGFIASHWKLLLAILVAPIALAVYMIVTHWKHCLLYTSDAADD
mgnify:CR=1 FL=1